MHIREKLNFYRNYLKPRVGKFNDLYIGSICDRPLNIDKYEWK